MKQITQKANMRNGKIRFNLNEEKHRFDLNNDEYWQKDQNIPIRYNPQLWCADGKYTI